MAKSPEVVLDRLPLVLGAGGQNILFSKTLRGQACLNVAIGKEQSTEGQSTAITIQSISNDAVNHEKCCSLDSKNILKYTIDEYDHSRYFEPLKPNLTSVFLIHV